MLLELLSVRCYHSHSCKPLLHLLAGPLLYRRHQPLGRPTWHIRRSQFSGNLQSYRAVPVNGYARGGFRARVWKGNTSSKSIQYTLHEDPIAPSDILTAAFRRFDYPWAVPVTIRRRSNWVYGRRIRRRDYPRRRFHLTLHNILAQYISFIEPNFRLFREGDTDPALEEALDQDVQEIFDDRAVIYLQSKGYDVSDVLTWAWVLASPSSERAALRLLAVSESGSTKNSKWRDPVPTFLFMYFLRRPNFTAQACKYLIVYSARQIFLRNDSSAAAMLPKSLTQSSLWQVTSGSSFKRSALRVGQSNLNPMTDDTAMIIVARLLRHTRRVWPAGMITIATIFSTYAQRRYAMTDKQLDCEVSRERAGRLSLLYNRILSLLALPSSQYSMRDLPYNQRAQFIIISGMSKFTPALVINREGYRAVTSIQLAHRKTIQEQEWARLKARSWPPWKEDKLGLDADKGKELGMTRAIESISKLKEAGYAQQAWERTATVYAGWDTDSSPTIQTRVFFRPQFLRNIQDVKRKGETTPPSEGNADEHLWASRISATRTLDEAWSCFLGYKADQLPPYTTVYHAMLQKLILNDKRLRADRSEKSRKSGREVSVEDNPTYPGDGREISAPPISPQESVHLSEPPPKSSEFLKMIMEKKIPLSSRILAFLLAHSHQLRTGMRYIEASSLPPSVVKMLVDMDYSEGLIIRKVLQSLPDYLLAAYVEFLVRVGSRDATKNACSIGIRSSTAAAHLGRTVDPTLRIERNKTLSKAVQSVLTLKPRYRPAWYSLLNAFRFQSKAYMKVCQEKSDRINWNNHVNCLLLWNDVSEILKQMDAIDLTLDFEGFHTICFGLEYLIRVGSLITISKSESEIEDNLQEGHDPKATAEEILATAITLLKSLFASLVRTAYSPSTPSLTPDILSLIPGASHITSPTKLLPDLLETPTPSHLHVYIRVLGLRSEFQAIQDLILWMAHYAAELKDVYQELNNGSRMMRKALVAARVFLEGRWVGDEKGVSTGNQESSGVEGAPEEILQVVYTAIESVEDWEGWPTDEEADAYCYNHGHGFV